MSIERIGNARVGFVSGMLLALVLMAARGFAQSPVPLLVDVDWLSAHADDRGLVVLHVGNKAEYDAQHIPGARFIAEADVTAPHDMARGDLMLELPPPELLRAKLAALGISDDSHVVVYSGKDGGVPSTTRIIFTLDYLGLGDRTSLLNGGMGAWQRAGKTVTTSAPAVTPGTLSARPTKPVVVNAEFVKSVAQRPNHRLVDARAAVFYKGIEPTFGKSGHIPGAANIPFTQITDNSAMIDRERVAVLFRDAGVKPGDTVVAYCHIGQQATAVIFAARLLGHPVALYDGAFQDWAAASRGPVEK
jgi:thiosulfate/3-mercaptopyruvate sulfurtransferase